MESFLWSWKVNKASVHVQRPHYSTIKALCNIYNSQNTFHVFVWGNKLLKYKSLIAVFALTDFFYCLLFLHLLLQHNIPITEEEEICFPFSNIISALNILHVWDDLLFSYYMQISVLGIIILTDGELVSLWEGKSRACRPLITRT